MRTPSLTWCRTDSHQLRPVAADSAQAGAVKVVTRAHKTLIWERTRHTQRLRHALREYFPAALEAFEDLDAPDTLELLAKAPDPASAATLTITQISRALTRARRRNISEKATRIQAVLRGKHLGQPEVLTAAYAATTRAAVAVLSTLNEQVKALQAQAMRILVSTRTLRSSSPSPVWDRSWVPGCSPSSGTTPTAMRTRNPGKLRRHQPDHRASGKKKVVLARYVHNDRLIDALMTQAFSALNASLGARAYYDQLKTRGTEHHAALRQLANRLVGILHGCLKTRTSYEEATAWSHQIENAAA